MDLKGARVLCVAGHPDDEVLGCGATLARAARCGAEIRVLLPTRRADPRGIAHWTQLIEQFRQAVAWLGGEAVLPEEMISEEHIDADLMALHRIVDPWVDWCSVLFTHFDGDVHQTHRAVARACEIASRPFRRRRQVLQYEVSTSTDQAFRDLFSPNLFVAVEEEDAVRKEQAIAFYTTEGAWGRTPVSIRRRLELRGEQIGLPLAEAFVLARGFV